MSRIGRRPIEVPAGVTVSIDPGRVMVNGPLGTLQQQVPARMKIEQSDGELLVGYSHPVVLEPRQGISFEVPAPTQVVVKGVDKQQVGQTAAEVRAVRPPEPYKGKGIRYEGEYVRRKVGKRA